GPLAGGRASIDSMQRGAMLGKVLERGHASLPATGRARSRSPLLDAASRETAWQAPDPPLRAPRVPGNVSGQGRRPQPAGRSEMDMADVREQLDELIDRLLAEHPPESTSPTELWGRQFDLGLAWVHHGPGDGGLGID